MGYAPFDLKGKVALITGGNRGIGLGMAEALAQAGADVATWGRRNDRNSEAVERVSAFGVRAKAYAVDVSDESAVDAAMEETVADLGRVDFVAANAGVIGREPIFWDFSTDTYRRVVSVNLDGVFFTLRAACKHMVARAESGDPGGSLVAIASIAAISGAAGNEAYAATKGAVISMIKAIAVGHARYGVRANAILPGFVATDMTERWQSDENFKKRVLPRVPVRRWGAPEDFGGVAVYLASNASAYHVADTILIDGGYTAF